MKILLKSVYAPKQSQEGATETIICGRPSLNIQKASTWASANLYYELTDIWQVVLLYQSAAKRYPKLLKQTTFCWDYVDVVRQYLADLARPLHKGIILAYEQKKIYEYDQAVKQFLSLIDSMDNILGTVEQWRFGAMFEQAHAKATTEAEKEIWEQAARRMVTTWSDKIGSLNDYSHRQLQGLMKDFYKPRWERFFGIYRRVLTGELKASEAESSFRKVNDPLEIDFIKNGGRNYRKKVEGNLSMLVDKAIKDFGPLGKRFEKMYKNSGEKSWSLGSENELFIFDVTDHIFEKGNFVARFQWKSGNHALEISKVQLYEGEKLVSEDEHIGRTGVENHANIYELKVDKFRSNLVNYTLKVFVSGVGGSISRGIMT
ncbi:MAG: alpha-N-acetylglucosaminidase C-terminal domain-containing protein, partial [Lentisphaeria bacterium]